MVLSLSPSSRLVGHTDARTCLRRFGLHVPRGRPIVVENFRNSFFLISRVAPKMTRTARKGRHLFAIFWPKQITHFVINRARSPKQSANTIKVAILSCRHLSPPFPPMLAANLVRVVRTKGLSILRQLRLEAGRGERGMFFIFNF